MLGKDEEDEPDRLEDWENAYCSEFDIPKFSSRDEFEEHCKKHHEHGHHHHHHKKRRREIAILGVTVT